MHNQIQFAHAGPADALLESRSAAITQPYRRYIEGWQLRTTYLTGQLAHHARGSDQHDLALRRLEELRAEIAANRDYLVAETGRLPPDDMVDATLDELDELLGAVKGLGS